MTNLMRWTATIVLGFLAMTASAQQGNNTQLTEDTSQDGDFSNTQTGESDSELGESRYITDLIYTPIRTGPGGDYRIVNKGLPSGTEVTYFGTAEGGVWAEVETKGGTRGYLRAQYLQTAIPRAKQVNSLETQLKNALAKAAQLQAQLDASVEELSSANEDRGTATRDLEATQQELAEIKRISANAIQLDKLTGELTSKLEDVNAQNDLLKLENSRLESRVASNQRLEGVLAVLAGIFLALVIPRLTVKRRRNDGWR